MTAKAWNIDVTHSSVQFSVRHMVFAKVRGRFGTWSGSLRIPNGDLTQAEVEATIDATSIDTGAADRDAHLRSPDFLDAERFPSLDFKSQSVATAGKDRYQVRGDLTIRDVTRAVVLDVEHTGRGKDPWGNERVGFTATTTIDRKDFGLEWNQVLEAGGVLVGERVEIEIEIQAVAAEAA